MKKGLILAALLILVGCDYTVPLTTAPALDIDRHVMGLWEDSSTNKPSERLLVLPAGPREYLVAFPLGQAHCMFAKACLARCADKTLVQLEWIGTAEGQWPDNSRVYQLACYSVTTNELAVRMLNTGIVNKEVKTSAELAKLIEAGKDNPALFGDPLLFKRVTKAP